MAPKEKALPQEQWKTEGKDHKHSWVELRRVVPYHDAQFDPFVITPERAKHLDATPHSEQEHIEKSPTPDKSPHGLNEVVFICDDNECQLMEIVPIPKDKAASFRSQLETAEMTDTQFAELAYEDLGIEAPK